jgi:hypothetical protein
MCQTSVSYSIYSGFSNGSEHVGDFTSATRANGPTQLPSRCADARDFFINAAVSRFREMENALATQQDTLATQQGLIREILQMAALLGDHQ